MAIKKKALAWMNRLLAPFGVCLVGRWGIFANYIPLSQTERRARSAGMSIGEYIDWKNNYPGATQETIDRLAAFGVFDQRVANVCEIGPGSGRYLEKIVGRCHPDSYEIYETASEWRDRLVRLHGVTARETDGTSLAQTDDHSVDLVHAHRVFEGLPVLTCLRYFQEVARVVRPGGWVFFDALTEECLTPELRKSWITSGWSWVVSMFPKQFLVEVMRGLGLSFVGSFIVPMRPGLSEYLIFRFQAS